MNQTVTIVIIAAAVLIFWVYTRNFGKVSKLRIDPTEAKKRLDKEKGIILLDVRNQEEYLESHIPKSTLIPLRNLAKEAGTKLPDKEATIFAYCSSGNRSRAAVKMLLKLGYTNVYNLGGIIRWPYKTVAGKKR